MPRIPLGQPPSSPGSRPFHLSGTLAALGALLIALAQGAAAQPSLYGTRPPPDAAFFRIANLSATAVTTTAEGGPHAPLQAGAVGAYRVLPRAGHHAVAVEVRDATGATARTSLRPAAGSVLTVLVEGAPGAPAVHVVQDPASFNGLRAQLSFYNAVPGCHAALRLEPEGVAVFADVAPGAAATRTIAPATATLTASCGERSGTVLLDGLEVGRRYSIWLLPVPDGARAVLTHDAMPGDWRPRSG